MSSLSRQQRHTASRSITPGQRRLSLTQDDQPRASSSREPQRASARLGTAFSTPKHGDEILRPEATTGSLKSNGKSRSFASPYVPGKSNIANERSDRRQRISPISTRQFYGRDTMSPDTSLTQLSSGAPSRSMGNPSTSVLQHRNAAGSPAATRSSERAQRSEGNGVLSVARKRRESIGEQEQEQGPIEISSDEDAVDSDGDTAMLPSGENKNGKNIRELSQSPVRRRYSAYLKEQRISAGSKDESRKDNARQSLNQLGDARSSSHRSATSPSPESFRDTLTATKIFTIASEEDKRIVARHAADNHPFRENTSVAQRLKRRDGTLPESPNEQIDKRPTKFAETMGSIQSGFKKKSQEKHSMTEASGKTDFSGMSLATVCFDGLVKFDEDADPQIDVRSHRQILLKWKGGESWYQQIVEQEMVERLHFSTKGERRDIAVLVLDRQFNSYKIPELLQFEKRTETSADTFHKSPAIILVRHDDIESLQDWEKLKTRLRQLVLPSKEVQNHNLLTLFYAHLKGTPRASHAQHKPLNSPPAPNATTASDRPRPRPSATAKAASAREGEVIKNWMADSPLRGQEEKPESSKLDRERNQGDANPKRLVWPCGDPQAITLLQSDIDKLEDNQFLNDTMIEFGLKYLLKGIKERSPLLFDQIYVFSSFFYGRFNEFKKDRAKAFEGVRKWTRNVDLFSKKYIVVPINEAMHWYLAIITNPFKALPGTEIESQHSAGLSGPAKDGNGQHDNGLEVSADTAHSSEDFGTPPLPAEMTNMRSVPLRESAHDEGGEATHVPVRDVRSAEMANFGASGDVIRGSLHGGGDMDRDSETPKSSRQSSPARNIKKRAFNDAIDLDAEPSVGMGCTSPFTNGRQLRSRGPPRLMPSFDSPAPRATPEQQKLKLRTWLDESAAILVFDSLGGKHSRVRTDMLEYLPREYKDKRGGDVAKEDLTLQQIDVAMPRQDNYSDCGFYVLYAFERFFSEPEHFMEEVIPSRDAQHDAWNASEAVTRRKWWRDEVRKLIEEFEELKRKRIEEKRVEKTREGKEVERSKAHDCGQASPAKSPSPAHRDDSHTTSPARFPFASTVSA